MPHRLPLASGQAGYGGKDAAGGHPVADKYPEPKEAMFCYTGTADAPWTVVQFKDKA